MSATPHTATILSDNSVCVTTDAGNVFVEGVLVHSVSAPTSWKTRVVGNPTDPTELVVLCGYRTIRCVDRVRGTTTRWYGVEPTSAPYTCVAVTPDGAVLAGTVAGDVVRYAVAPATAAAATPPHVTHYDTSVSAITPHPDGGYVGTINGNVYVIGDNNSDWRTTVYIEVDPKPVIRTPGIPVTIIPTRGYVFIQVADFGIFVYTRRTTVTTPAHTLVYTFSEFPVLSMVLAEDTVVALGQDVLYVFPPTSVHSTSPYYTVNVKGARLVAAYPDTDTGVLVWTADNAQYTPVSIMDPKHSGYLVGLAKQEVSIYKSHVHDPTIVPLDCDVHGCSGGIFALDANHIVVVCSTAVTVIDVWTGHCTENWISGYMFTSMCVVGGAFFGVYKEKLYMYEYPSVFDVPQPVVGGVHIIKPFGPDMVLYLNTPSPECCVYSVSSKRTRVLFPLPVSMYPILLAGHAGKDVVAIADRGSLYVWGNVRTKPVCTGVLSISTPTTASPLPTMDFFGDVLYLSYPSATTLTFEFGTTTLECRGSAPYLRMQPFGNTSYMYTVAGTANTTLVAPWSFGIQLSPKTIGRVNIPACFSVPGVKNVASRWSCFHPCIRDTGTWISVKSGRHITLSSKHGEQTSLGAAGPVVRDMQFIDMEIVMVTYVDGSQAAWNTRTGGLEPAEYTRIVHSNPDTMYEDTQVSVTRDGVVTDKVSQKPTHTLPGPLFEVIPLHRRDTFAVVQSGGVCVVTSDAAVVQVTSRDYEYIRKLVPPFIGVLHGGQVSIWAVDAPTTTLVRVIKGGGGFSAFDTLPGNVFDILTLGMKGEATCTYTAVTEDDRAQYQDNDLVKKHLGELQLDLVKCIRGDVEYIAAHAVDIWGNEWVHTQLPSHVRSQKDVFLNLHTLPIRTLLESNIAHRVVQPPFRGWPAHVTPFTPSVCDVLVGAATGSDALGELDTFWTYKDGATGREALDDTLMELYNAGACPYTGPLTTLVSCGLLRAAVYNLRVTRTNVEGLVALHAVVPGAIPPLLDRPYGPSTPGVVDDDMFGDVGNMLGMGAQMAPLVQDIIASLEETSPLMPRNVLLVASRAAQAMGDAVKSRHCLHQYILAGIVLGEPPVHDVCDADWDGWRRQVDDAPGAPVPASTQWRAMGVPNEPMDKLMELVGMEDVKKHALQVYRMMRVWKDIPTVSKVPVSLNFAFLGNPGTGKTTVAKLFGALLQSVGARQKKTFIETSGAALKRGTPADFAQMVAKADGGVLFIDEAYQLTPLADRTGREIVDELLLAADQRRETLTIILAGYKDDMERELFAYNIGMMSRFTEVTFHDFHDTQLLDIWNLFLTTHEWKVDDPKVSTVAVARVARTRGSKGFGNARSVRIAFHTAVMASTTRPYVGNFPLCIKMEDVIGPPPSRYTIPELGVALGELDKLSGLREVKRAVYELVSTAAANYERELRGEPVLQIALNRLMFGNPGTGKTTVARIYGDVLKSLRLLSKGGVELRTASDFVGEFVGSSASKTSAILAMCQGKVLVIDEAYNLNDSLYGKQALDTIVEKVSGAPGEDIAVLLLGYEKEIKNMLRQQNPGLSRRFNPTHALVFKDYDNSALACIAAGVCKEERLHLTLPVLKCVVTVLSAQRALPNFGNAGAVRNLLSVAKSRMLSRGGSTLEVTDVCPTPPPQDPLAPLRGLYGMSGILDQFTEIQNYLSVMKRERKSQPTPPMNWLFFGGPGTGKTTVAKCMGGLLHGLGVLVTDHVEVTSAVDLTGEVVGAAKKMVEEAIGRARGGVLFIDEAYMLGVGAYGEEAETKLVQVLTDPTYMTGTAVVLAGYEPEMRVMLARNAGLESRFQHVLHFPNWSGHDATRFVASKMVEDGFTPEEGVVAQLEEKFNELASRPGWANARDAISVWRDKIQYARASRVFQEAPEQGGMMRITVDDVVGGMNKMLAGRPKYKIEPRRAGGGGTTVTSSSSSVVQHQHQHQHEVEAEAVAEEEEEVKVVEVEVDTAMDVATQLDKMTLCPQKYGWVHLGDGKYRCKGGTHFVQTRGRGGPGGIS